MLNRIVPLALMLATIPARSIEAQQSVPPAAPPVAPSGRVTTTCDGQRIDDIIVYSEAPAVAALRRFPALQHLAREVHAITRPELIRRFLLLEETDPCNELRRAESERILRAQPFIADADVFVVPNDRGGVDLEVRTSDETSIVLGGAVQARSPIVSFLLFGNANIAGQGIYASASWRDGEGLRDAVSARLIDRQFLGRPWVFSMEGERATLGGSWRVQGTQPFLTDIQRVAWRVRSGMSKGFVELRMPNGDIPTLASERSYFDVGGIIRIGSPGRLSLFGASLSGDDEWTGDRLLLPDNGVLRDVGKTPREYAPHKIARANVLLGVRDINYVRREGLDALTATQDVPLGFQLGTQFGRSLAILGAKEDDMFMAGDLYMGAVRGIATLRIQAQGEARRRLDRSLWDGVLSTGRVTQSLKFSPRNLNQVIVEWSGGSRQRTPFQLLIGVPDGGVRGYEESMLAGGRRIVARVEERLFLGKLLDLADAGVAVFTDAGRQWAGDVPFGVTTPVKASIGFSILASVPPHSPRLWRADIAFPISGGANARWTLRFTNADRTQFVFREARDVAVGREVTVPSSIFAWP